MCGIYALLYHETPDELLLEKIQSAFMCGKKRGPESSVFLNHASSSLILGFHRLAINGLNNESDQPITHQKNHIICNGEIYNYKELFKQQKIKANTDSDCEIILRLYEKNGPSCVSRLDGVFSFVLYDEEKKQLMVGRDPYGVRPLYMCYYKNKNIGFSSDIKPLLFDKNIEKIYNFEAGTYALFNYNNEERFWYMSHHERYYFNTSYIPIVQHETKVRPIEYYMHTFVEKMKESVQKRVNNCERDIACLLSGGLDSGIVSALVNRMYKEKTGNVLETYSIGLNNASDFEFAKKMSQHIGSKHHEIIVSNDDFIKSIPDVIRDIESYDTTTVRASVGNWNIGKYIAEHSNAKVVFNGDGSDELAGGYLYFNACPSDQAFHEETLRLLTEINRFDALRSDKSISSHGLEPRTPFLDKELTRYYLSIPIQYRNHNKTKTIEKYFIRKAFELYDPELLPPDILWRKKEAFSDGVSSIEKSWYQIIQEHLDESVTCELSSYQGSSHNRPETREQLYYRTIFEQQFTDHSVHLIPSFWMPRFVKNAKDASARTLELYDTKSEMD